MLLEWHRTLLVRSCHPPAVQSVAPLGVNTLSLVGLSRVPEPTRLVASTWISMRPMHDTAFVVPLEHSVKCDGVTSLQPGKAGREVDVVGNQQRLAGSKCQ